VTPGAALAALVAWRRRAGPAVLLAALAAGTVWGGATRLARPLCVARLPAPCEPSEPSHRREAMQAAARARLAKLFGARHADIAAALTIDPDAHIPGDAREAYRRSGLTHLLSISGFHVAILAGALLLVLRAARIPQTAARIAGAVAVAAYVWLLGVPPPAVRSAALLALCSWSKIRQRPSLVEAGIAATAAIVVTLEPFAVVRPGPWLSFVGAWACVAAAAWWSDAARGTPALAANGVLRFVGQPLVVSLGATLATAPITILAFGSTAPAAVFANLAAVPLAALVVPAIAVALLLAMVGSGAADQVAAIPAAAASLGLDGLELVAEVASRWSFATVELERRLFGAVIAALVAWIALRRAARTVTPRPAGALAAGRAVPALLALGAAALWSPLLVAGPAGAGGVPPGRLALFFLPVGQGDAAAIRTPHGRWIVIDAGPRGQTFDAGSAVVVPFLRRQHVGRLAALIVSHSHTDHLGGAPAVLRAFRADLVLETGKPDGQSLYREYLGLVVKQGTRWHAARAGDRFTIDGVTLRVWHPDSAWLERNDDVNESSVVLTVEYGAFRAAFPGDAGLPMEDLRAAAIGAVDVLKVGHHGSRTATGDAWLEALGPALCVVPVGRNDYGHPDPGTIAALERGRCRVLRTDRERLITLATDGRTLRLTTAAGLDTGLALGATGAGAGIP
jgi:competence protein ComEC